MNQARLRAVSLWQPWATLIAIGAKRFETRDWPTDHVGPLAIQATKSIPDEYRESIERLLRTRAFVDVLEPLGYHTLADFPMGKIVAITTLDRCLRVTPMVRGMVQGNGEARGVDEIAYGDYAEGRYAWALGEPIELKRPVDCRGDRKLWEVPDEIAAVIAEQLRPRAATLPLPIYTALGFDPALFGTTLPVPASLPSGAAPSAPTEASA